jgi:phage protein D
VAYRSVFVDGKIVNPKTKQTADLRLFGENKIPYVSSISITSTWGVDSQFSISLTPTYDQAMELISKKQPWLRMGNTVALRWGYSDVKGAFSDWHMGMMLSPEVSFGEEIGITIPVMSYGFASNRVAGVRSWSSFENQRTFQDVADEIAKVYGMKTDFRLISKRSVYLLMDLKRDDLAQHGRTDLQFLVMTAQSAGAQLVVRNNKFIFVDEDSSLIPGELQVSATFSMYGKINIEENVYPLNSFSCSSLGPLFLPNYQGTFQYVASPNADPAKEPEVISANDSTSEANAYSSKKTIAAPTKDAPGPGIKTSDRDENQAKSTREARFEQMEGGRFMALPMSSDYSRENNENILSACAENTADDHGLSVEFETMALPFLIPGMLIQIDGVGDYFSTIYKLNEMELTIDSGGANMTCQAGARGFPGISDDMDLFGGNTGKSYQPPRKSGVTTADILPVNTVEKNPY